MKYTEEISGETFRKKVEERLFTQKAMQWNEMRRRAAMNPLWQWHRPDGLDKLKEENVHKDIWREQGGFIEKGPAASVKVQQLSRNGDTGIARLRITPMYSDTVYGETAPPRLRHHRGSPDGDYETGEPLRRHNQTTRRLRVYQKGAARMVGLRAAPPASIRDTTDGSDPKAAAQRRVQAH